MARKKKSCKIWVQCSSTRTQSRMYVFQYCLFANTRISDSCFIFVDNQNLHHTDRSYSSLISSPIWLQLSVSSPLELEHCPGQRKHISQCLNTVQTPPPVSAPMLEQERPSTLQACPSSQEAISIQPLPRQQPQAHPVPRLSMEAE